MKVPLNVSDYDVRPCSKLPSCHTKNISNMWIQVYYCQGRNSKWMHVPEMEHYKVFIFLSKLCMTWYWQYIIYWFRFSLTLDEISEYLTLKTWTNIILTLQWFVVWQERHRNLVFPFLFARMWSGDKSNPPLSVEFHQCERSLVLKYHHFHYKESVTQMYYMAANLMLKSYQLLI